METESKSEINHVDGNTTNTPFHNASTATRDKQAEDHFDNHLSPIGSRLTPVSTRRSGRRRPSATLSRSRSYIDGHSHYNTRDDDSDEGGDDDRAAPQTSEKTGLPENDTEQSKSPSDSEKTDIIEVKFDGKDDPMNPKNMSKLRKWLIVITLAWGSMCVTCTSSLYTTIYKQMNAEFGSSRIEATLGLALFVFGLGLSPMFLGPLSEFYGRRPIYIFAYLFFTIWLIPCAVAQNIQTMLIARFLDGLSGSAFLSVAGGSIGDMFARDQLQFPMMIYSASPFLGPGYGPVIGGFINYYTNWRWSFYVLLIWSGIMLVAVTLIVPETYAPVVLRNKARKLRAETGDKRYKAPIEIHERSIFWTVVRSLYRPFLLLILEPMCGSLCLFSAILLGILYLFFGAFPLIFSEVYGFNEWQSGLTFVGIMIGMFIAILSDPIWHWNYLRLLRNYNEKLEREQGSEEPPQDEKPTTDATSPTDPPDGGTLTRKATTSHLKSEPELRLPPTILGGPLATIGLFFFSWTTYPSISHIVPLIGAAFFGCGISKQFSPVASLPSFHIFPTQPSADPRANRQY